MNKVITLTDRTYQRLRYEIESPGNGYPQGIPPRQSSNNWQHVRVTGAAYDCDGSGSGAGLGSGSTGIRYYPAVVELWDATNEEALDLGACVLIERHDYPLVNGNVYPAQQSGVKGICGTAYPVFVTAVPVAGLETDLNGSGSGTGLESGAGAGNGCDASGTADAGAGLVIPFAACDADGNPCTKNLVITSPFPLAFCITDPNNCG